MAKRILLPASPLHPPPLTWEGCGGDGEPGEQQRPWGARLGASGPLLSPGYHEKSQRGAPGSRAAEGVAPSSHRYAVNHTGIVPLPRVAGFAAFPSQSPRAYLQLGNPQELFVKSLQPSRGFCRGTFGLVAALFSKPRPPASSGSLLDSKGEKSSWNPPAEQKAFCAGGSGGRGCFRGCHLRFSFLPAEEHLLAEQGARAAAHAGDARTRGQTPPTAS